LAVGLWFSPWSVATIPLAEPETTGCGSGPIVGALLDEDDDRRVLLEDEEGWSATAFDDEDPLCSLPDEPALLEEDPLELVLLDFAPLLEGEEEVLPPADDPLEPVLVDAVPVLMPLDFAFFDELFACDDVLAGVSFLPAPVAVAPVTPDGVEVVWSDALAASGFGLLLPHAAIPSDTAPATTTDAITRLDSYIANREY
jgi:hypothetical protein